MINFANNDNDSREKKYKKLQEILNKLYTEYDYYDGDFFHESDLSELLEISYNILFLQNKNSCQFTIDKNPNNSLDITIDKIT
jgi:hypothetical protein